MRIRPITISGDRAFVPLTQGKVAIIDAADAALVGQYNWCAVFTSRSRCYAVNGKSRYLHRFLMRPPADREVAFINDNPLDNRRSNLQVRALPQDAGFAAPTHCRNGHAFDAANTYVSAKGMRTCRECNRICAAAIIRNRDPAAREARRVWKAAYDAANKEKITIQNAAYRARRKAEKAEHDRSRRDEPQGP
jgi:hypothetical protein